MSGEKKQKILLPSCNHSPDAPYLLLDVPSFRDDQGLAGLISIQDFRALCASVIE